MLGYSTATAAALLLLLLLIFFFSFYVVLAESSGETLPHGGGNHSGQMGATPTKYGQIGGMGG